MTNDTTTPNAEERSQAEVRKSKSLISELSKCYFFLGKARSEIDKIYTRTDKAERQKAEAQGLIEDVQATLNKILEELHTKERGIKEHD